MLVEVIGVRHNHLEPGTAGVMCKTAQDLKKLFGPGFITERAEEAERRRALGITRAIASVRNSRLNAWLL
jgi:hypothetical protein